MRGCVALAVCLLLVPAVAGQPLPETLEGTDPTGDVQGFGNGVPLGPVDGHDFLDVTGARVEKHSSTELLFALGIVDPEGLWLRDDNRLGVSAALHFVFGGAHYFIEYAQRDEACLRRYVSAERYDQIDCAPVEAANGELVAIVPSTPIRDLGGVRLRHPAQLSEVWAEAREREIINADRSAVVTLLDRAPDADVWGSLRTPVDPGAGPLLLTPVRGTQGSNGGAGVLLFELVADNIDAQAIDVVLTIDGLPQDWSGLVPARLHLEPGESRTIPLLVSTPFGHDHGSTIPFTVTAEVLGLQVLTEELEVHFFDVPQPAGHHPTLYVHSGSTSPGATRPVYNWIDTLPSNPKDEQLSFTPTGGTNDYSGGTHTDFFLIDMVPGLGIGLDFDLSRPGQARFVLQSDIATTVTASIRLEHCNPADPSGRDYAEYRSDFNCPGTWLPVLEAPAQDLDLAMGSTQVDVEMTATAYADLLPFQQGSVLAFVVELESPLATGYPNTISMLPTDARIDLPVFEFQPPLTGILAELGSLEVIGEAIDRSAGPGSQLVMQRTVANNGDEALDIDLDAIGYNAQWVEILPATLHLEPGEEHAFEVMVTVPPEAGSTEFAQVYLVAASQGDDQIVSVLPMRINAQGPEVHEQPTLATDKRESPGTSAFLLGFAILALALARRNAVR